MSKKLKVAIAGQGRSGYGIHANWLRQDTERYEIVAIADNLPERREQSVKEFGCKAYHDYKEMIAAGGFDLFVNATPSRFHVDAALSALNGGFHLVSEKPAASCVAEFDKIVDAANRANRVYYPFQNSRFYPFFTKMREIIASGVLGDMVYVRSNWSGFARRWDWQTLQRELAGNLFNTGPHPVDQAVVLFGDGYPEVFCKMVADHAPFEGDAENFCMLTLHGAGKPTIEIFLNSFQAYPMGDMYNISATRGGLTATTQEIKWKYYLPEEAPNHEFWKPWSKDRGYCSEQLNWHEETWKFEDQNSNNTGFAGMVALLYANVYDVIVNGAKPEVTHEQVRRQVYIMEEAHKQNPLPRKG